MILYTHVFSILFFVTISRADYLNEIQLVDALERASENIATTLQKNAIGFNEIWNDFKNCKNISEQVSMFPAILTEFANSYNVFANEFKGFSSYYHDVLANADPSGAITIPTVYMNLLSSTLSTVGDELNEVVVNLDDLKNLYYHLVSDINKYPFNNNHGIAVISLKLAKELKEDIMSIASLNDEISNQLYDAVSQANVLNLNQLLAEQPLDPTGKVLIYAFEDIGDYLGMITKEICSYTDKFGKEFPLEIDTNKTDFINLPELIANSNVLFNTTQKVYNSVASVFPMLNKMVPFITLLYTTID